MLGKYDLYVKSQRERQWQQRMQVINQVQKLLEDANLKMGVSRRLTPSGTPETPIWARSINVLLAGVPRNEQWSQLRVLVWPLPTISFVEARPTPNGVEFLCPIEPLFSPVTMHSVLGESQPQGDGRAYRHRLVVPIPRGEW